MGFPKRIKAKMTARRGRSLQREAVVAYLETAPADDVPALMQALNVRVDQLRPPTEREEQQPAPAPPRVILTGF